MGERTLAAQRAAVSSGVGHSHLVDSGAAGREAVSMALEGHIPTADDLVILFTDLDYDVEALYRAAWRKRHPPACSVARAPGDSRTRSRFRAAASLPSWRPTTRRSACAISSATMTTLPAPPATPPSRRASARETVTPNSVLLLLTDGLTRDQREIARGAYEVTTAVIPFVGGAAADNLTWDNTHTFGEGRVLSRAIVAVWINSERPMGVSVDHGWRPAGKPMLVTRAEGTVVHELDGTPALEAYLAEQGGSLEQDDVEFFRTVMGSPVGLPNARGRYDVRQLHAFLPEGGGINFNTGVSEQSILQVMSTDDDALIEGARRAAEDAVRQLDRQGAARPRLLVRVARPAARRPDPRRGHRDLVRARRRPGVRLLHLRRVRADDRLQRRAQLERRRPRPLNMGQDNEMEEEPVGGALREDEIAALRERLERTEQHMAQTLMRATRLAQVISVLGNEKDLETTVERAAIEVGELFFADMALLILDSGEGMSIAGHWGVGDSDLPQAAVLAARRRGGHAPQIRVHRIRRRAAGARLARALLAATRCVGAPARRRQVARADAARAPRGRAVRGVGGRPSYAPLPTASRSRSRTACSTRA